MHRGDRQRALARRAIVLRNVHAPERTRAIASLAQCSDSACFLLRGVPNLPVDPRGLPAIVGRHSLYSKRFTAKRVGQEMLQGTHLAPSSRLHCLHNTRLEPPHRPVDGSPVNGLPGHRGRGECTSQCCHRCHLLSLCQRLVKLSCDERPDGRLPACAWGDVARCSTPIHPITGWHSLLPSSHSRTPIGLPCGSLSLAGDVRGSHVPSQSQSNG